MVIQLAEVAAKGCCRGRKLTEGERDPALAGSVAVSSTERKRNTAERFQVKAWSRRKRKREQQQETRSQGWLGIWVPRPHLDDSEETPILALWLRAKYSGLALLWDCKVTHRFGISYVRALGDPLAG